MTRRVLLVTLSLTLLSGCMAQPLPTAQRPASRPVAPAAPHVQVASASTKAPSITVRASAEAAPAVVAFSEQATLDVAALDADLEAIDLLAEAAAGYQVQTFFGRIKDRFNQAKDAVKRTWTRIKLKRAAKAELKNKHSKLLDWHKQELEAIRAHRTAPVTQINPLEDGGNEIVTAWSSDHKGVRHVETRRHVDAEGVTQVLIVSIKGESDKGEKFELLRTRTLQGEDGAYRIVSSEQRTLKDGRTQLAEWTKNVAADGAETLTGAILHPDGHRTEISGTRDAKGKVKITVEKIKPAPVEPEPEAPDASDEADIEDPVASN